MWATHSEKNGTAEFGGGKEGEDGTKEDKESNAKGRGDGKVCGELHGWLMVGVVEHTLSALHLKTSEFECACERRCMYFCIYAYDTGIAAREGQG